MKPALDAVLSGDQPTLEIKCGYDADDQSWVCRTGAIHNVETNDVGPVIGDFTQNLRGALDYLIWDLSILDSGAWPTDSKGREMRTQFPICISKTGNNGFDSRTVQNVLLDHISPPHRTEIERFQPYVTGDDALILFNQISNEDKHRAIRVVAVEDLASAPFIFGASDCEVIDPQPPIIQGALEPDTEILRLLLRNVGSRPKVDVGFERIVRVAFPKGPHVFGWAGHTAQVVTEILDVFEADLTTPAAQQIREAADAAHR